MVARSFTPNTNALAAPNVSFAVNRADETTRHVRNGAVTITGSADPAATVNYFHTGSATPRPAERDAQGNWVAPNVPMYPMSNGLVKIQFRIDQDGQAPSFQLSEFSVNKVATAIGNDGNGSITNLPGGMGVSPMILAYDCENNLHCVSNTVNGTVSFYWYDQSGRRIAKSESGLLTLYIWDGMDIIATANADGTIREYFTRGIGIAGDVGSLVAETRFENNAPVSTTYLHSNWRGDVVMATDTAGNVVGTYAYTTFGEQLSSSGTYTPRFTFSSKERDVSGLVYFGLRYYSPVLCRWISEDPIRESGGINLYQFCFNNPIGQIDIDGLKVWSEGETFDLLMNLRSHAQQGGLRWAWNQYMDPQTISNLDFKYLNPGDYFIVEGDCYKSDSFGNFVAGWIGQNAGGVMGVAGSLVGGIIFDLGNVDSPNPRWNPDADSRADILNGVKYARNINFIKSVNAMFGLP